MTREQQTALVLDNRLFAQNVARKLYGKWPACALDYDDFESAAMIGLCEAARRYCAEHGASFRSFAYLRIRGAVYDLLRRQKKAPLLAALEGLGIRLHENGETVEASYREGWDPEEAATRASERQHIHRLLEELPRVERRLMELYYYEGLSFQEIRDRYPARSKSWLSRLHHRAIERLRGLAVEQVSANEE